MDEVKRPNLDEVKRPNWYARWLSPEGYLGLHLVAGFVVALLAGFVFDYVEDSVFDAPATLAADAWAQNVAHGLETPALTQLMLAASWIGSPPVIGGLSLVVAIALLLAKSHRRFYAFAATMAGGSLLNVALKTHFARARPSLFPPLTTAGGFSFPSGHSMGSMLFFASLAYVLYFTFTHHPTLRVVMVVLCGVAVFVIGGSRIYLGVHYLSDVAAGFVAGLGWAAVCLSGTESWVKWRDWRRARRARGAPAPSPEAAP